MQPGILPAVHPLHTLRVKEAMNLFSMPDPVSMYEAAVMGKLERAEADAFVSAMYSGWISFWWSLGAKALFGLGPAMRDMATAQYLTLTAEQSKNFLKLTVPEELLTPANLSRFETEWKTK